MGVNQYYFQGYPDSNLKITQKEISQLYAIINETQSDLICLPHYNDRHQDHFAANVLLAEVIDRYDLDIMIAGYEIWAPLEATILINITEFMDEKIELMQCYQSQLELFDYISLIRNMAAYRNILHRSKKSITAKIKERDLLSQIGVEVCKDWCYLESFRVMKSREYAECVYQRLKE